MYKNITNFTMGYFLWVKNEHLKIGNEIIDLLRD